MEVATLVKCPEAFVELEDEVMSNFDGAVVNERVAQALQSGDVSSRYPGWNFNALVWWDKQNKKWMCEVWQYRSHVATVSADSLRELATAVSDRYGHE